MSGIIGVSPNMKSGVVGGFAEGQLVQSEVYSSNDGSGSYGTTIPMDSSVPTNSEGTQIFTLAFTPKSATNTLLIDGLVYAGGYQTGSTDQQVLTVSLFKDSDTSPITGGSIKLYSAPDTFTQPIPFRGKLTSGTTSEIEFKVRLGANTSSIYYNRTRNAQYFGGLLHSRLLIQEFQGTL